MEGVLAEDFERVLFRPAIFGRQDMYLFRNKTPRAADPSSH